MLTPTAAAATPTIINMEPRPGKVGVVDVVR